ncbi:MAG: hypothetical protein GMKNLPBB_00388 [Myxococcota bacterium]|nr:hypothetical protein [Myxococcota bacterium]
MAGIEPESRSGLHYANMKPAASHDRMESRIEEFNRYIAKHGLKSTRQRDHIVQIFFDAGGHVSAEELHLRARESMEGVGFATVYRTIRLLVESGLAEAHHFGDGTTRYEPVVSEHHDHLICRSCGAIVEFHNDSVERLQDEIAAGFGYRVLSHKHEIYGVCPDCQSREKGARRTGGQTAPPNRQGRQSH